MKISYAISNLFVNQVLISLTSALENNSKEIIDGVVIAGSELTNEDIERIRSICDNYDRGFQYINADETFGSTYKEMGLNGYGGYVAPWMFICPHLIAADNNMCRLLMLDADTIVCGSLSELETMDLDGKVMAAVIAVNNYKKHIHNPELRTLTKNKRYFNCGVILYNIKEWVANDCWSMIYQTCINYHPIDVVEQTLLNNSIPDHLIRTLGLEYNYWGHKYRNKAKIIYELSKGAWYSRQQIEEAISNPKILHYKDWYCHPWHRDAITTNAQIYHEYESFAGLKSASSNTSIYSEIENNSQFLKTKKKFFLAIEKTNSLLLTKIGDNIIEICQWIKNKQWSKTSD